MNTEEFEEAVWTIEKIRIVVRAPSTTVLKDYSFKNAADESWRVTEWLEKRIAPRTEKYEIVVIQGDGEEPHGKVILRTLRAGYA